MRKIAVSTIASLLLLGSISFVSAQSANDLQAQLNALLAQLAALQAQLQTQTGGASIPTSGNTVYGQCPNLSRNLRQGSVGSDVTALQAFLAADTRIYPEGTISGYFGALTQAAVQRFQVRHAIVTSGTPDTTGYGMVGPTTRRVIASVCGSGSTPGPQGMCSVGGVTMAAGQTVKLYSVSAAPAGGTCAQYAQTRQCVNGSLSGSASYQFANCSDASNACQLDGVSINNGESRTFFRQKNLPYGLMCQSASRSCNNGVLTGSSDYPYASCTVATTPTSCTLDGATVAHGQSRVFYKQSSVMFGQSCSPFAGTRACDNGNFSGDSDYRYATCTAAAANTCTVVATSGTTTATTTVSHSASRNFWSRDVVPYTETCDTYRLSRTCNDGTLSGSSSYKYGSCTVTPQQSCTLDNKTVAGGSTATFYSSRTNSNCANIDQERTCTNGTLSGTATYQYSVCAPSGQQWCQIDGTYIAHGQSATLYSTRTASYGSQCSQFSGSRTCTNGTLGGSSTYQYGSCTAAAAASCTLDGTTVASGQAYTFYSTRVNANCAQFAQSRNCVDGTLSGSGSFQYSACSSSSSFLGQSNVAAALAAFESILHSMLDYLKGF